MRVVADVDTGIDDALALVWLAARHRAGEIDLQVTTSAGNTTAALAARNSVEVLGLCGASDVSVTAGAVAPRVLPLTTTPETHGPEGLGYWIPGAGVPASADRETTAADAVAAWVHAEPDHLLIAGPATNLAYAVEHHPDLLRRARVTLMCGAFTYPGNTTPTAEWNAWVDPHALSFALENWPEGAEPPVICPLNVTEQVILTPERLAGWTGGDGTDAGSGVVRMLQDALRFYFEFHASVGVGYVAQIHDLAAAMVMLQAVDAEFREATVAVEAGSELLRGTTVADGVGEDGVGPYWGRPANARILTSVDVDGVFAQFAESLRP
ncbi:MAG: nucleoside hydrolase [Corynebacterium sp.]|uniref:nucleoside hydrolase n=1 Tax=unclassified Corynebacterium TaxID=2624378 RepID=UPI000A7E7FCB|nr:nucleoside hydrolase [Corynebacterium sp. CNJ-954]